MRIEIVFALPDRQALLKFDAEPGITAWQAVEQSGIAAQFPEVDLAVLQLGVWGRTVDPEHVLEEGDRVEIYRPLIIDPREARRQLAAEGRSMGSGDGRAGE